MNGIYTLVQLQNVYHHLGLRAHGQRLETYTLSCYTCCCSLLFGREYDLTNDYHWKLIKQAVQRHFDGTNKKTLHANSNPITKTRRIRGHQSLRNLFLQLTDNIIHSVSDNQWTPSVARLYLMGCEVVNKLHSKCNLKDMKQVLYEEVKYFSNKNITH